MVDFWVTILSSKSFDYFGTEESIHWIMDSLYLFNMITTHNSEMQYSTIYWGYLCSMYTQCQIEHRQWACFIHLTNWWTESILLIPSFNLRVNNFWKLAYFVRSASSASFILHPNINLYKPKNGILHCSWISLSIKVPQTLDKVRVGIWRNINSWIKIYSSNK